MPIKSVVLSNHLILCCPLLLPSVFSSIREKSVLFFFQKVSSSHYVAKILELQLISPSNEFSRLISFRIEWLDLLTVQGTLKSLLQHHSSKASILWLSAFFMVQLSHRSHNISHFYWYFMFVLEFMCARSLSHVLLLLTSWTIAHRAPLSMWYSRQGYWSRLPFPPSGNLPGTEIKLTSPASPALEGRSFTTEPPGKPYIYIGIYRYIDISGILLQPALIQKL